MNTQEIQKLRRKFIIIAMLSFLLVMVFIGAFINISTHVVTVNSIKSTLKDISINQGIRADVEEAGYWEENMPFSPTWEDVFSPSYRHNHFFYIKYNATDSSCMVLSNSNNKGEIERVSTLAEDLLEDKGKFGSKGVYYFLKEQREDGDIALTILDCTSEVEGMLRILTATVVTMLLALLISFILVRVFSNKLIQPEIENSQRQRQFITNASHELKTPLAVIRANTELLEVTGGQNEWTTSTLNQVDHLNGLIQNLVMISKAAEKEDVSNLVSINATEVVEQTIKPYEAVAKKAGTELTVNTEKDVMVLADESKLRQLATILIDNAIKYCDKDGKVEVELSQTRKNKIKLTVANSYAEGKDVDYNMFFDRFYREDKSHNIDKGGYGIGLSIAESICRQYGGSIKAVWKDGIISFVCQL